MGVSRARTSPIGLSKGHPHPLSLPTRGREDTNAAASQFEPFPNILPRNGLRLRRGMDPRNPARVRRFGHEDDEERAAAPITSVEIGQSTTRAKGLGMRTCAGTKAFVILGSECERSECADPGIHAATVVKPISVQACPSPVHPPWLLHAGNLSLAHGLRAGLANQPDMSGEADAWGAPSSVF